MQHFLICRNGHCLSRIKNALNISRHHLPLPNRDDPVRVHGTYMTASNTDINRVNLAARHKFCFFHGSLYGIDCRLNIDHHAFLHAPRGVGADANNFNRALTINFTNDSNNLRSSNIQPNDHAFFRCINHHGVSCQLARGKSPEAHCDVGSKATAAPCS